MPAKNIVVCADGTGNSFRSALSNVARLVKSLDLDHPDQQIVLYDQGVGTTQEDVDAANTIARHRNGLTILPEPKTSRLIPRRITRLLGLGFGYGLKENVAELYRELARVYSDGDRLYLFGFSRGAFTARVLAGLIHRCGLLQLGQEDHFSDAFKLYKKHYEHLRSARARENLEKKVEAFRYAHDVRDCRITFLGLWDTVKSYGFIYPKSVPHLRHNSNVVTVRHALALDERRSYYQPTSWGGIDHPKYDDVRPDDSKDVKEVWFAGSHSDVGGGYDPAHSGLALASLEWMIAEARTKDIRVNEEELQHVLREFPSDRKVTNSLTLPWWIPEVLPRFELENLPISGVRRLKWGPSGRRHPEDFRRAGHVYVHSSVRGAAGSIGLGADEKTIEV